MLSPRTRTLALVLILASILPAAASSPPVPFRVPPATGAAPRVTRDFVGLSFETGESNTGLFDAADAPLLRLFGEIGAGSLRLGGNSVDRTPWDGAGDTNGHGLTPGFVAPSDVDRLAGFLRAVPGWRVIYSLDLAAGDGGAGAREAQYVAGDLPTLSALAIGNEPDLYARNGLRPSTYSYAQYAAEWSLDRRLIGEAAPRAPVSGPDAGYDAKRYTLPFIAAFGPGLRVATQHYYIASSCSGPTVASLLKPDPALHATASALVAAASAAGVRDGLRYDEVNSYYSCTDAAGHEISGTAGVSDSFASALWAIDLMGELAADGVAGVNFHSGGHASYSPIQTARGAVIAVKPEFYGLWLFARALRGCPCGLAAAARDIGGRAGLNAVAIRRGDGGVAVILSNEGAGDAAVGLSGLPGAALDRFTLRAAGGLADTDPADVSVDGATVRIDGRWSGPVAPENVPAPGGGATVAVPAGAAVLVVAR